MGIFKEPGSTVVSIQGTTGGAISNTTAVSITNPTTVVSITNPTTSVSLVTSSGGIVKTDNRTMVIIDYPHHEIHAGSAYGLHGYSSALAKNTAIDFLIQTSSEKNLHIVMNGAVGGNSVGVLLEGPTLAGTSANGANVTFFNRNRSSTKTSLTKVFAGPTYSSSGTEIVRQFMPGGSGKNAVGGAGEIRQEWILKPSENYGIKVINVSGDAIEVSVNASWYEESI